MLPLAPQQPHQKLKTLAFVLGLTSIIAQILLLREFLSVFYGNEIVYAVILASWLFWVAAGSFVFSRLTQRIKTPSLLLSIFLLLNAVILPVSMTLARIVRTILNIPTGEIIAMTPMLLSAFVLLMPLTFVLGAVFTSLCRLAETQKGPEISADISTVYLWEAIGAAAGGLLYSFMLIHILPAMTIAGVVGLINVVVVLVIFKHRHVRTYQCGFVLFLAGMIVVSSGLIDEFDAWTRRVQWQNFTIVAITDSIYGNIALTKLENEYSLFENGILSFSSRDRLSGEENVHFPLLAHPAPGKVLLIGGGVGGALKELLKYKGLRVDYVELDPKIISVSQRYLPADFLAPLKDQRVAIYHQDARLFVKQAKAKYDVIILNIPDPYTALINRYYTLEFFKEAARILHAQGVLSLSVSSSENYLNQETRAFLRSLNTTLGQVLADVQAIPGDTNFFLACKKPGILTIDADVLSQRLKERSLDTLFVREYYLPFRLSPDRMAYIRDVLSHKGRLNLDLRPIAYLYDIILWSTHFNTSLVNIYKKLEGLQLWHLLFIPAVIFLAGMVLRRFDATSPITLSIMTTGFSEIIFQVIVIMAFQSLYGYAYYKVGLILTSFMAGLVLGSLAARKILSRPSMNIMRIYKIAQGGICIYPLLLPFVFIIFRDTLPAQKFSGFFATTFAVLPVVAGFLGGLQYPLAAALVHAGKKREEASQSAGFLYALDVLGASLGALLTGTLLIPLLGINAVACFCAVLNGAVLFLLLIRDKTG